MTYAFSNSRARAVNGSRLKKMGKHKLLEIQC